MAAVETPGVDPIELTHPAERLPSGVSIHQAVVVRHQTVSVAEPVATFGNKGQDAQILATVLLIQKELRQWLAAPGP